MLQKPETTPVEGVGIASRSEIGLKKEIHHKSTKITPSHTKKTRVHSHLSLFFVALGVIFRAFVVKTSPAQPKIVQVVYQLIQIIFRSLRFVRLAFWHAYSHADCFATVVHQFAVAFRNSRGERIANIATKESTQVDLQSADRAGFRSRNRRRFVFGKIIACCVTDAATCRALFLH